MQWPNPIRRATPKNIGLMELIRAKRQWQWKPSIEELQKGFRGWHQRGYLPHFDAPHVSQFITFQLHDSFPAERNMALETILKEPDDSKKNAGNLKRGLIVAAEIAGCGSTKLPAFASRSY
jgi:hypothetical protein